MPTIAQPFLLTEYYRMCRREGLQLPKLFQLQLIWQPKGDEWKRVQAMFKQPLNDDVDEEPRDSHQEDPMDMKLDGLADGVGLLG